jgi:hypothetical protein
MLQSFPMEVLFCPLLKVLRSVSFLFSSVISFPSIDPQCITFRGNPFKKRLPTSYRSFCQQSLSLSLCSLSKRRKANRSRGNKEERGGGEKEGGRERRSQKGESVHRSATSMHGTRREVIGKQKMKEKEKEKEKVKGKGKGKERQRERGREKEKDSSRAKVHSSKSTISDRKVFTLSAFPRTIGNNDDVSQSSPALSLTSSTSHPPLTSRPSTGAVAKQLHRTLSYSVKPPAKTSRSLSSPYSSLSLRPLLPPLSAAAASVLQRRFRMRKIVHEKLKAEMQKKLLQRYFGGRAWDGERGNTIWSI